MCITPFRVMHKLTNCSIPVPCGRCPECISKRISGWSFRLMQEYKIATTAEWVTLTYDTKHVPISPNLFMTLNKKHCQDFFKRLRKSLCQLDPVPQVKYYLVGEYGHDSHRPHYHAVIFNVPDWSYIEKAWGMGNVFYGDSVNEAAIGYTLKYMDKPKRIPMHRNDDREKEFSLMSKGLGANYINEETLKYHHADLVNRVYLTVEDGKKITMPRYYKEKIYHPLERMAIKANAAKLQEELLQKRVQKFGDMYNHKKFVMDQAAFKKQISSQKKRNKI